jgi:hypothetical protein
MPKTKISEFDSTPANNTDIDSINIAEGCAPSGINNAIRELMSQLKDQQTGAAGDNFTVGGNLAVTGTSAFTGNAAFVGSTTFTGAVVMSSASVSSGLTGNVTGNVTGNLLSVTNTITSGSFISGNTYVIATLGTTDFTLIGASANTVGVEFTATDVGTGTGTATTVTGRAASLSTVLPVTKGGTGNSSVTPNAVFVGGTTSTSPITAVKPGVLGNVLTSTASTTITAGSFVVGVEYSILTIGSTDFTLIGAASNTVGVVFTATGVGVGSGTAQITTWQSSQVYPLTRTTVNAGGANPLTTGTVVDFTSIPSWVKRITIMFSAVSTSGTSFKQIQLIYGGSTVVTTGYRSSSCRFNGTVVTEASATTGFVFVSNLAADDMYGSFTLTNLTGNTWTGFGGTTYSAGSLVSSGGIAISGTLTGVRITTVNGTDTFDAGSINILYE